MSARRPLVDLSRRASPWRRFVAWCWSWLGEPPAYRAQPCDSCGVRTVHIALVALLSAAAFIVYALRGVAL
jgi:hypothetical protein